jgi:citrate synthase
MYASLGGAMAALYGPLHGRANQDCLDFLRKVGTGPDAVEAFVRTELATAAGHLRLRPRRAPR